MLIGYARISTSDQHLHLQQDALKQAGCDKICMDTVSGVKDVRSGLGEALSHLRSGDTLVVWKLDRLGRSLKHLIETVTELDAKGISFRSLQENLDTTTSGGKLIFHIFGALAEFERELIKERTNAGLKAARARGRSGGRPKKLDLRKLSMAKIMLADPKMTVTEVAATLGVARSTLYRSLNLRS